MAYPFHLLLAFLGLSAMICQTSSTADAQSVLDQIGYTQLQSELGASLPLGASAKVALIEAHTTVSAGSATESPTLAYIPDLNNSLLTGKTINVRSLNIHNAVVRGHATGSAQKLFGSTSTSPAVDNVDVLNVSNLQNLLTTVLSPTDIISSPAFPFQSLQDWDVSSHSYIINRFSSQASAAEQATELAIGLDFLINSNDSIAVVGSSNASPTILVNGVQVPNPSYDTIPFGLAPAYNIISVGKTNGNHGAGLTTFYGPNGEVDIAEAGIGGRVKVEIVAPEATTSAATPRVGSAAALLHDAGQALALVDSTHTQTLKAILLAGATKDEFSDWDKTSTRPLDDRYGAGELNIYNSYMIQAGGEHDGSATPGSAVVGSMGWDYEASFDSTEDRFYDFLVDDGTVGNELSIVLSWNVSIDDPAGNLFDPVVKLANFDLELTNDLGEQIDISQSTVDNIEHIYARDLPAGTYRLRVSGDSEEAYGLAWRLNSSTAEPSGIDGVVLGDVNLNGTVNFADISPFISLLLTAGFQTEADIDQSGNVDFFDISPFVVLFSSQ